MSCNCWCFHFDLLLVFIYINNLSCWSCREGILDTLEEIPHLQLFEQLFVSLVTLIYVSYACLMHHSNIEHYGQLAKNQETKVVIKSIDFINAYIIIIFLHCTLGICFDDSFCLSIENNNFVYWWFIKQFFVTACADWRRGNWIGEEYSFTYRHLQVQFIDSTSL